MRIISQSGMIDLPYEQVAVTIDILDSVLIIAYSLAGDISNDETWILSEYSTPEKAKKAMEMLRDHYVSRWMLQMADDKAVAESLAELGIEEFAKQAVFQFPQDEEIEV